MERLFSAERTRGSQTDIAVFRPSDGIWYLLQAGVGFGALQSDIASDTPTSGSFIQ